MEWLVAEMEQRQQTHVRHPRIIVLIDELADLLMQGGSDLETLLTRLVQRGRSAGICIVACTQKPTAGVLGTLGQGKFSGAARRQSNLRARGVDCGGRGSIGRGKIGRTRRFFTDCEWRKNPGANRVFAKGGRRRTACTNERTINLTGLFRTCQVWCPVVTHHVVANRTRGGIYCRRRRAGVSNWLAARQTKP